MLGVRLSLIQVKQSTDSTSAFHERGGAAEPLGFRPAFPFQDFEFFFRRITVALSFFSHRLPATIIFYFIPPPFSPFRFGLV